MGKIHYERGKFNDGVKWTNWKNIPDYSADGTHYLIFSYPAQARYIEIVLGDYAYDDYYGTYLTDIFLYQQ